MPFEQWTNTRRGFDISISNFAVDETTIIKQAIDAMSLLRTLHWLPGSLSWPHQIQDNVSMPISATA
jgi:hypothetical protein